MPDTDASPKKSAADPARDEVVNEPLEKVRRLGTRRKRKFYGFRPETIRIAE